MVEPAWAVYGGGSRPNVPGGGGRTLPTTLLKMKMKTPFLHIPLDFEWTKKIAPFVAFPPPSLELPQILLRRSTLSQNFIEITCIGHLWGNIS